MRIINVISNGFAIPEPSGGFVSGDFSFSDFVGKNTETSSQASPRTGDLFFNFSPIVMFGVTVFRIKKNGNIVSTCDLTSVDPQYDHIISVSTGDLISFSDEISSPFGYDWVQITIRNAKKYGKLVNSFSYRNT